MNEIKLPQSPESERALLGALIINPEAIRTLRLDAGDIYIVRNRWIYEAIYHIAKTGGNVDYMTIADELRKSGRIGEIGGEAYLTELIISTPNSLHIEDYAKIIRDRAQRRKVILSAQELVKTVFDLKSDLSEAIAKAASEIVASSDITDGARLMSDVLGELWDEIELASHDPRDIFGIPTGMSGFDRITSGLQRKEVFMLSGEPGVGKSFLAFQLGIGAAEGSNGIPGTPGAVFELEMSALATVRRAVSVRSRVGSRTLRSGRLEGDDWTRLTGAVEHMSKLPVYISDNTNWTTTGLRAECARLKSHGIGWVIIDYLALLKDLPGGDEVERSAVVSDRVHDIAKDLDLAIVAIHDMTKAGMTGQVGGQAGLSGSRRVSYNADMTAFLRTTENKDLFNLEWAKFREDSADRVLPLRRVPGFPAYAEVAH